MKSCPTCSTVLPDDPYRSTTIPIAKTVRASIFARVWPVVMRLFTTSKLKTAFGFVLQLCIGTISVAAIAVGVACAGWLLVPGIYKLGLYVSPLLGHQAQSWLAGEDGVPFAWFLGLGCFVLPIVCWSVGESIMPRKKQ